MNSREQFAIHCFAQRGFTLLELLVVLSIIGLMAALVAPKLAGPLMRMNLQTAAKKIAASLRYARSQAASEKATYTAVFDFDNNKLSIIPADKTQPEVSGEADDRNVKPKVYDLPEGVKLAKGVSARNEVESGLLEIRFFPSGASTGGTIVLSNEREKSCAIDIDFITGIVKLID